MMVYYKVEGEYLQQYKYSFNIDELLKLRQEIIDNCGFKKHVISRSTVNPNESKRNDEEIRDLKIINTNETKSYSDTSEDKPVFIFDYIKVKHPHLVNLIDRLISGEETVIYDINKYEIETKDDGFDNKELELIVEINDQVNSRNLDGLIDKINHLSDLIQDNALNRNNKSTMEYYNRLLNLITYEPLFKMPLEMVKEYQSFMGDYKYNFSKNEIVLRK